MTEQYSMVDEEKEREGARRRERVNEIEKIN